MADRDRQQPAGDPAAGDDGPGGPTSGERSPGADGAPDRPEPRAGDLVAGRVHAEDLDPVTLAQLAAWFGGPSAFGDTPPHLVDQPADGIDDDPEVAERRRRVRELLEAADAGLLGRIEGLRTAGDAFVGRLPAPPPLAVERPVSRFDLSVWNLRLAGEPREVERPSDIADAMEDVTPQAVLRDLHRPVSRFNLRLDPVDLGVDVGGDRAHAALRDAMGTRYQVRMDEVAASRIVADSRRELRERLAEPWEDAYQVRAREDDDDSSLLPGPDDMYWFNMVPVE